VIHVDAQLDHRSRRSRNISLVCRA
jgi:hypothetical protein